MNIDINDIKSFVTVAELKSMTAAALKLNYLQSNITAKIKKIEHHYDRQLFIRQPKGVELTESGLHLYSQYKKMLFIWEETENKIHQQKKFLRFGTNTSLGGMRFYPAFQQLYHVYPELSITMKTGATGYIEDEILQGHLDIAYILGKPQQKNLQYIHQADDELVLIGKNLMNSHDFKEGIHQQNILLASSECCYGKTLDQLYADCALTKGELTYIHDMEALIQFTQLGMGISMIAKSLLKKYNIQYFMEIPKQYHHIGLYLIARQEHIYTAIEKQFIGLNESL